MEGGGLLTAYSQRHRHPTRPRYLRPWVISIRWTEGLRRSRYHTRGVLKPCSRTSSTESAAFLSVVTLSCGVQGHGCRVDCLARFLAGLIADPWHLPAFHRDYNHRRPPERASRPCSRGGARRAAGSISLRRHRPGPVGDLENTRCPSAGRAPDRAPGVPVRRNRIADGRVPLRAGHSRRAPLTAAACRSSAGAGGGA